MASLSTELWAVIIGGAIAVVPVSLQLIYDRTQRKADRKLQLRREVYLEAAESLAGSLDDFFQMTRADVPLDAPKETGRRHGWLNKIILVADYNTVVAFSQASASVATAVLDILVHRLDVAEVDDTIKIRQDEIFRIRTYQQELKEHGAVFDREPPTPKLVERLEWVAEQLQGTWRMLEENARSLESLNNERWAKNRALMERAMRLGFESQKLVRRAQVAARSELEMTALGASFDAEMERLDRQISAKADETFGALQTRLTTPAT